MKEKTLLIVPVSNNREFFSKQFNELITMENTDILIVDDGSDDGTFELMDEIEGVVYIKHELPLGYGASFITGYEYGRDMEYDLLIYLDPNNENAREDIKHFISNMDYGYDIVSCSRILENQDAASFSPECVSVAESLSASIKYVTDLDITDPLSGILAVRTSALRDMELTDYSHGLLLQLWIQCSYYQLTFIEIPASSGESFGMELGLYEDPEGHFLSIIETEKYLYPRGSLN